MDDTALNSSCSASTSVQQYHFQNFIGHYLLQPTAYMYNASTDRIKMLLFSWDFLYCSLTVSIWMLGYAYAMYSYALICVSNVPYECNNNHTVAQNQHMRHKECTQPCWGHCNWYELAFPWLLAHESSWLTVHHIYPQMCLCMHL